MTFIEQLPAIAVSLFIGLAWGYIAGRNHAEKPKPPQVPRRIKRPMFIRK
jgi:hypothetical protein